jgi:hypothetical protein
LLFLWVLFAANALVPSRTWGYDAQIQPSIAHDGASLSAFDYDSASMSLAEKKENRTSGTIRFFDDFAELFAAETAPLSIGTPYGAALQSDSAAALAARGQVADGATLYPIGTMGKSAAGEAQFWSLEHPLSPGYAARYGVPEANVLNADFIETATLKPGTNFITRPAPGFGTNPGGGIEAVTPSGGVDLQSFHIGPF